MSKKGVDKYYKKQMTSNKDSYKKDTYASNEKVNLVNVLKKGENKKRNSSKASANITDDVQEDKGPQATS
jgi:hypothetical protein